MPWRFASGPGRSRDRRPGRRASGRRAGSGPATGSRSNGAGPGHLARAERDARGPAISRRRTDGPGEPRDRASSWACDSGDGEPSSRIYSLRTSSIERIAVRMASASRTRPASRSSSASRSRDGPSPGSRAIFSDKARRSASRSCRSRPATPAGSRRRPGGPSSAGTRGRASRTSSGRLAARAHSSFIRQTAGSSGRRSRQRASQVCASSRSPTRSRQVGAGQPDAIVVGRLPGGLLQPAPDALDRKRVDIQLVEPLQGDDPRGHLVEAGLEDMSGFIESPFHPEEEHQAPTRLRDVRTRPGRGAPEQILALGEPPAVHGDPGPPNLAPSAPGRIGSDLFEGVPRGLHSMPGLLADTQVVPGLVPTGPARQDFADVHARRVVMSSFHLAERLREQCPAPAVLDRARLPTMSGHRPRR